MASKQLKQWMNGVINYVKAAEPDLTNRQLAVLMVVHYQPGPHTVRGLAKFLNVSKPVITRALDKLTNMGLLLRQPDETDGRNVFIVATSKGAAFLAKLESYFEAGSTSAGSSDYLLNDRMGSPANGSAASYAMQS